ncbi:MAG: TraB/GumN family protein [Gammaproteobacteria bacterium]|nr:TraB/GumN family protein [Gammaproteobacteria bacterium]
MNTQMVNAQIGKIGSIALIGLCVVMLAACSGLEQRRQNHPPLWKIHSAHHDNNVWLFGTMHTMPRGKSTRMRKIQRVLSGVSPRLVRPPWVSNEIFTALVSSEKLVIELGPSADLRNDPDRLMQHVEREWQDLQTEMSAAAGLPKLGELRLDAETTRALQNEASSRNIAFKRLQDLPLPAVLLLFSIVPNAAFTALSQPGAEDWLVATMRLRDRRIDGLEQRDGRLLALVTTLMQTDRSDYARVIKDYLATSLQTSTDVEADLERIYANWLRGDSPARQQSRMQFAARYPEIHQAFIAQRNFQWLDEITHLTDSGERVFIAVGEAHLYGPGNLRELLTHRGYRLQRIH